jgi:hypothetical protein
VTDSTTIPPRHGDFSSLTLDVDSLPVFHRTLLTLRFPLAVEQVLDLRSAINLAVDSYAEPPLTRDHREFRERLERVIDKAGIDSRHRERLLKLTAMLRDLYYEHNRQSRDRELYLRDKIEESAFAQRQSRRIGVIWLSGGIISGLIWLFQPEAGLFVKLLTAGFAYLSFDYFHALPSLARRHEELRRQLNDVLRVRVENVDWSVMVHRLALVLGYKQERGVEVFRIRTDTETDPGSPALH